MILFHGSSQEVREPRILVLNRTLDYGVGFYTTTSEQQARDWALRRISGAGIAYVNVYAFDETAATHLKRRDFTNPPEEDWVDFVYANRNRRDFVHDYDLVYGPVANDRVYAAFALLVVFAVEYCSENKKFAYVSSDVKSGVLSSPSLRFYTLSSIALLTAIITLGVFTGGQFIYFQF